MVDLVGATTLDLTFRVGTSAFRKPRYGKPLSNEWQVWAGNRLAETEAATAVQRDFVAVDSAATTTALYGNFAVVVIYHGNHQTHWRRNSARIC